MKALTFAEPGARVQTEAHPRCDENIQAGSPHPPFLAPGTGFMEDNFSMDRVGGDGFRMIQAHYLYCTLYFYYYYISSTSDHRRLGTPDLGHLEIINEDNELLHIDSGFSSCLHKCSFIMT